VATPGQCGDAPQAPALLAGQRPKRVIADTAYDSDALRRSVAIGGASVCIKPHPSRTQPVTYDAKAYRRRNVIERFFGALRWCRRVATRYDKKVDNYLSFVWLAALLLFLK
jgi:transposase